MASATISLTGLFTATNPLLGVHICYSGDTPCAYTPLQNGHHSHTDSRTSCCFLINSIGPLDRQPITPWPSVAERFIVAVSADLAISMALVKVRGGLC